MPVEAVARGIWLVGFPSVLHEQSELTGRDT